MFLSSRANFEWVSLLEGHLRLHNMAPVTLICRSWSSSKEVDTPYTSTVTKLLILIIHSGAVVYV